MADYRNDEDRTLPGGTQGLNRTPERDPEHLLPSHTHAAAPGTIGAVTASDPDAVRDEIQRTRERMSETIGAIEGALQRKKEEVRSKLDFAAPVRERPWMYAAGVFGGALALGWLTGGGNDDDDHVKVPRKLLEGLGLEHAPGGSGGDWEARSRELMQVVARQEEEIRELRGGDQQDFAFGGMGTRDWQRSAHAHRGEWDEGWNYDDAGDGFDDFSALDEDEGGIHIGAPLAGAIAAGVAGIVGGLATRLLRRRGAGMDVEVELEREHGAARDVRVDEGFRAARRERLGEHEYPLAEGSGYASRPSGYGEREMDVEVELERPAYAARPTRPYGGREMELEVELEGRSRRGPRLPAVSPLAAAVAAVSATLVGGMAARLIHGRGEREMEVEVDLERGRETGYGSRQPMAAAPAAPQPTREMQVEVDLESRGSTGGTSASPRPAAGAERTYEVELERGTGGTAGEGTAYGDQPGSSGSQPPLM